MQGLVQIVQYRSDSYRGRLIMLEEYFGSSSTLQRNEHDGFRVIARKDGDRMRLYSRPGNDLTGASSFQRPRNPPLLPPSKSRSGKFLSLMNRM